MPMGMWRVLLRQLQEVPSVILELRAVLAESAGTSVNGWAGYQAEWVFHGRHRYLGLAAVVLAAGWEKRHETPPAAP